MLSNIIASKHENSTVHFDNCIAKKNSAIMFMQIPFITQSNIFIGRNA